MKRINHGPWAAAIALLSLVALGAAPPPAPEPEALPIEVTAYEVSIAPDFLARSISGEERIRFRAGVGGARLLRFSPTALAIDATTLDGWPLLAGHTPDA